MSLDVTLRMRNEKIQKITTGIFVRENGQTKEISKEEWDLKHPGQEPIVFMPDNYESDVVFEYNITHNLGVMADAAGIYEALWRPEEIKAIVAKDNIKVGCQTFTHEAIDKLHDASLKARV